MSSIKYASPLRIKIQPSRVLLSIVIMLYVGAVVLVFVSTILWEAQLLLMFLVLCSLLMFGSLNSRISTPNFIKRIIPRVNELVWADDDSWLLVSEAGDEQRAKLLMSSFVHSKLTVVNLKLTDKPWYSRYRSFVFLPDNLDAETFRRLRIRLRWYSTPDPDNSPVLK